MTRTFATASLSVEHNRPISSVSYAYPEWRIAIIPALYGTVLFVLLVAPVFALTGNPFIATAIALVVVLSILFREGRRDRSHFDSELDEAKAQLLQEATSENQELRDELKARVTQLAPATRFEAEQRAATRSSAVYLFVGIVVVATVVGVGLYDWIGDESAVPLSTADAVARISVIGAAFYLAGQLFRRSALLNIRAQEFQRAAIAMAVTDSLADLMEGDRNEGLRAEFRRSVYEHHLKGTSGEVPQTADPDGFVKIVDSLNKLRGGPG